MTAWDEPTISESVKEIVSSETNIYTVAFAVRLGVVLIIRTTAPAVAPCSNARKLTFA